MTAAADAWYDALADRGGLTRRQLLVWTGDRVAGDAPVFVEAARWHLDGTLDAGGLARAFAVTVASADALRTTIGEIEGWPVSRTSSEDRPALEIVDLAGHAAPQRALDDLAQASIAACAVGKVLVVPVLARLAWDRHVLLLAQHQMVSDAWSFGLLHRRLEDAYGRRAQAPDPGSANGWPQFAEYVAFERAYRRSAAVAEARRYWESVRAGGRPTGESASLGRDATRVRRIVVPLGTMRSAAVRRVATEQASADVGLFVFFAAVVAAHLHRTLGGGDVVLDVPFANRPSARFKETLGTFMNVCPVRVEVAARDRFRDLRARLAAATWEAARHQTFTGCGGGVPQAYDVLVNVHRPAVAAGCFGGCAMRVEWLPPTHRFGAAAVAVHDFGATGELTLVVDLNEGAFSAGSRAAFAASLLRLVDEQLAGVDCRLADADRRGGSARTSAAAKVGAPASRDATVWSGFVARAHSAPDAVAVRSGDATVTYGDLLRQAAAAASRLTAAGAGRDTVVAVWGARGPHWLRTLLGVLASGAVYLPLDPSWPLARVAEVLRRSGARLLVVDGAPSDVPWRLAGASAAWTTVAIDAPADVSSAAVPPGPAAGDVAYVLYTSGSTGAPKGALVEHAGLRNHLDAKIALLGLARGDRVAQSASAGFDVSLWQCLAPLVAGAEVDILADDVARAPATLARVATARRVTVLEVVPTVLRVLLDAEEDGAGGAGESSLACLRFLVVTGEALAPELCRRWFARRPSVPLVNAYGPTECADDVTHHVLRAAPPPDAISVPIGRPIPGMSVYVLDTALRPVPDGEPGELCVAGVGVARGYLGDAARSAAAFVTRPLGPAGEDVRVYRTGDRGRRLPDGTFAWLGRLDAQVKIRGMRVEPAEVEATLGVHPDVRQAVVLARGDEAARRLVAYVVLANAGGKDEGAPRAAAAELARVREWGRLWDDTYARESPGADDAAFDAAGWRSRYTRRPIPAAEMREWLDGTVDRVRALAPRSVLEIGCGSGMVLARLAPACARWLGVDLSAAAVDAVRRRHLTGGRLPHVAVTRAAAHEIVIPPGFRPDVVLLNSVVQYFPSLAYLHAVLAAAWTMLDEDGTIFVGDVRSLPLARTLHTSVELARAGAACTAGEVRARIERSLGREPELLIDPAFFAALARAHGGAVDVQLKRGRAHNELTRFRYDVTWRRGRSAAGAGSEDVVAWSGAGPTLAELRQRLAAAPDATIVLHGVPNPRLQRELLAVGLLAAASDATTIGELRDEVAARPLAPGLDPEALWTSAIGASHDLAIGWSPAGLDRYDARVRPRWCGARRDGDRPDGCVGGSTVAASASVPDDGAAHANDPARVATSAARVEALRAFLRARLPDAMMPAAFVVVPEVPLTANGKVDHAALAAHGEGGALGADDAAPLTPLERTVAAIWARLLGVSEVGRDDDFFALGGDSLLVYRVLRALRAEVGIELDLERFLVRPTVAGAASAIAAAAFDGLDAAEADALLADVEALPEDQAAAPRAGGDAAGEGADA
ncbi:MAG: amino acid adenylation domain-containing protein [Deltaproteobacteria bacterium]|nr:amino acid adenylation domain-containing protein [Deltaproteobacteria bacterium]